MPDIARINVRLFHASKVTNLKQLDPAASHESNIFGPGIYATADRRVAESQYQCQSIYRILVKGPAARILELDHPLHAQTIAVGDAIRAVCARYRLHSTPDNELPLRTWLDRAAREIETRGTRYPSKTLVNRALADEGVWLLRGSADGIEATFPQDEGKQWCFLKADHITILEEQPRFLPEIRIA